MPKLDDDECAALPKMLRSMFVFRPQERATIDEVSKSEWMVKWALPAYEKMKQLRAKEAEEKNSVP
ncbi:hypothetical protein M501DRAFT_1002572 [Patellaria atrata CBS 101060]|uniref:Uncharacterized protein n=1 Tax=Patellaria atrata CBS 101060 TaxID=1346257 RepID=A0A9P4VU51_9PEZI|nr:hypothetical protein M501DRAFT_1002572 [Patellaria atrata CBS 101060]